MNVKIIIFLSFILCWSHTISAANEDQKIGPFAPGMKLDEAMEIAPEFEWQPIYFKNTSGIVGAYSQFPFHFLENAWFIKLGSQFDTISNDYVSNIEFVSNIILNKRSECRSTYKEIVFGMEQKFGVFGTHPEFKSAKSLLYGDPYGDGFKIAKATKKSKYRAYPKFLGDQQYSTFREPQQSEEHRIFISAYWSDELKNCGVEIAIFVPFEYQKGNFIAP